MYELNKEKQGLTTQPLQGKFAFAKRDEAERVEALKGEPVGYFKDALRRFCKNKSSLVATAIIVLLLLFSIIAPIVSPYTVSYQDERYKFCPPESGISTSLGLNFWDGCEKKLLPAHTFYYYKAIGTETGRNPVKKDKYKIEQRKNGAYYSFRLNGVNAVGCVFLSLTKTDVSKR